MDVRVHLSWPLFSSYAVGTIVPETSKGIRFRCVAHYVKVVATPEGPGVVWTPTKCWACLFLSLKSSCSSPVVANVRWIWKGLKIRRENGQSQDLRGKGRVSIRLGSPLHPLTRRTGGCHSAAGLSNADVLLCPIRLTYVPSKETTTVHIAAPLHLHQYLLFLCPGACLLNPALGKWPALYCISCTCMLNPQI